MNSRRCFVCILTGLLLLSSCSSLESGVQRSVPEVQQPAQQNQLGGDGGDSQNQETVSQPPPGNFAFPGVADSLALLRSGSFNLADGYSDGADFSTILVNQRLSAAGSSAVFAPAWPPEGAMGDKSAFGIWNFSLPAYFGTPVAIDLGWSDAPDAGLTYVGLANFNSNRWFWKKLPASNRLSYGGFANFIGSADNCMLVVVVLGTSAAILDSIQISTPQPPVASIVPDSDSGIAPLSVSFDGSASSDPDGSIVNYEWDLDGDGLFNETGPELTANGNDTAAFTYASPGTYIAQLRLTDNEDFQGQASAEINVAASQPPVAALSADVSSGNKPLIVTFNATASMDPDGAITDYEWDFDGDGIYGEAGPEADNAGDPTPLPFTYTSVGSFAAKVRVTDNDDGKDSETLTITVSNSPPIADLQANVTEGDAPFDVSFDASASSDPGGSITDYEWDFDNDGLFNEAGTPEETAHGSATPAAFNFASPGIFSVSVKVTDDDSAQDTAMLVITAHGWVIITIPNGDSAINCDVAEINGHPAVCWRDGFTTGLRYAYSSTPTGTNIADWTLVDVDIITTNAGWNSALIEVAGAPAIAEVSSSTGNLQYHRANTATGNTTTSWTSGTNVLIENVGTSSWMGLDMEVISGNPAICVHASSSKSLKYYRASTADGALAADWSSGTNLAVDAGGGFITIGMNCSLADINGMPGIAYGWTDDDSGASRMYYVRSTTSTGGAVGDWAGKIQLESVSCAYMSLRVVDNFPAIIFQDNAQDLRYRRANTATGSSSTHWTLGGSSNLTLASTGNVGNHCRLAIINGNPAAIHREDGAGLNTIRYLRSSTSSGGVIGDWNGGIAENAGSGGAAYGEAVEFEQVDGRPTIVFRGSGSSGVVYGTRF
jgi:PKD repeat protein